MTQSAVMYMCVHVTSDTSQRRWVSDLTYQGRPVVGLSPAEVLQRLVDYGAELLSTSHTAYITPHGSVEMSHVVWVRFAASGSTADGPRIADDAPFPWGNVSLADS